MRTRVALLASDLTETPHGLAGQAGVKVVLAERVADFLPYRVTLHRVSL